MIVILGPTACGKTRLAVQLARQINGEIISADSRQVYRDMNIGTGKDLDEYIVDNQKINYHLIDIVSAGDDYNLYRFQQDFSEALVAIQSKARVPILCGGSGLYLDAVLRNYQFTAIPNDTALRNILEQLSDVELLEKFQSVPSAYTPIADVSTRKRLIRAIEISNYLIENQCSNLLKNENVLPPFKVFGLDMPVEKRRELITHRLRIRLQSGMVEEVENLINKGISVDKLKFYGLEYKFITQYLVGELSYETMVAQLNVAIHQFAKRQMTFFRKMERDGLQIQWLDATKSVEELIEQIKKVQI